MPKLVLKNIIFLVKRRISNNHLLMMTTLFALSLRSTSVYAYTTIIQRPLRTLIKMELHFQLTNVYQKQKEMLKN